MTADIKFRKAINADLPQIWIIIQQAIQRRKEEGSNQWQDGYPNEEVIKNDLHNNYGYVLTSNKNIVGEIVIEHENLSPRKSNVYTCFLLQNNETNVENSMDKLLQLIKNKDKNT